MFKKTIILNVLLVISANYTLFSQAVAVDTVLSNAAKEIAESVPQGTKIAVLNISSDYGNLSDYIINELIVNLVNTRKFQIVPRSTIELEAANNEFSFQMTGYVSDENQKSLGKFLEAGTIVTGTVTRDTANSYRLVINAIDLESFTYQSSYRASFVNDKQVKVLVADSGGVFYEDYTAGQRVGMGALNMFFGIGSIMNRHHIGWVVTSAEIVGIVGFAVISYLNPSSQNYIEKGTGNRSKDPLPGYEPNIINQEWRKRVFTAGGVVIGAGIVFGYIVPFFHHKPNNTSITHNDFPFNFELASSNNQNIDGLTVSYKLKL